MGVYINMDMPTRCGDCPMGDALCCSLMPGVPALWKEYTQAIRTNRRHKECPLVPVPPHGRLGDLNALAQQIEHERFHHTHTDSLTARHHVAEYGHFLKAIFDAPTIIPASEEGET